MATEIDKRVVEMEFDNKDFEKNCQKSLTTLEKLKMALNFDGAKGLDSMAKAADKVDLSNLSKGADAVSVRFSAMQVVGLTAIQELTRSLLNFGRNVWANTFGQIKSGGMARTLKIEQAMFQMKALAKNIKGVGEEQAKVNALIDQMKDSIDRSVTGTAYGYDAAAAVASQLMASGLTDSTTMYNHLRAIAGAAAMTGRSFEDIGNIFTTVASNGRLMTMQLRQFSAAGLNLSATLAQSLGKTEEQINDMVTKGKISFEDFSKALFDAFGDAAGKADDTFSGVTSNIKAQLSRIGQLFTDPFVENVIPFFKEVKARIKDVNTVLKPMANTWTIFFKYISTNLTKTMKNLNVSKLRRLVNGIENILVSLVSIIWTIGQAVREVFPKQVQDEIYDGITGFERFTRTLIPSKEALNDFKNIVKALLIPFKALWTVGVVVVKNVIYPMLYIFTRLVRVVVSLGGAFAPVIDAILSIVSNGEFLSNVVYIIMTVLINLADVLLNILEMASNGISFLVNSGAFQTIVEFLKNAAIILSEAILKALLIIFVVVQKIISYLNIEKIQGFFEGVLGYLVLFGAMIMEAFNNISKFFDDLSKENNALGDILKIFKELGALIYNIFNGNDTTKNLENIKNLLGSLGDRFKATWEKIKEFLHGINAGKIILYSFSLAIIVLILSISKLFNSIAGIADTIKDGISNIVDTIKDIREVLKGMIKAAPALQVMIGLVGVILAIAFSLKMLSEIEWESLKRAGIILGGFALGLIALAFALSKIDISSHMAANVLTIVPILFALTGSVLLLATALRILAGMKASLEELAPSLIAISILLAELAIGIIAINATAKLMFPDEKAMMMSATAILAFTASVAILVACVLKLKDLKLDQAVNGLLIVGGLIIALAGACALLGATGMTFSGGLGAIGFVLSFVILLKTIQKISEFPFDDIKRGLINAGSVMGALALLYLAFVGISLMAGGNVFIKNVTAMLFGFVSLIGIASLAVYAMGNLDENAIGKGLGVITYLVTFFSYITRYLLKAFDQFSANMKTYKDKNILKSFSGFLIAFSACLVIIAVAARIANGINGSGLFSTIAIMIVLAGCAKLVEEASAHTKRANIGVMIAFMAGVVAILTAMVFLTYTDLDALWAASCAVAVVLGGLALVAVGFREASIKIGKASGNSEGEQKGKIGVLVAFILGIMGIIASLGYLTKSAEGLDSNALTAVAITIVIVLGSLVAILATLTFVANKLEDPSKLVSLGASLALLVLFVAGMGAIVIAMTKFVDGWEGAVATLASAGSLIIMLASIIGLFDWFLDGPFGELESNDVLKAAASIVILSVAIAIIAGAITGMSLALGSGEAINLNAVAYAAELFLIFAMMMQAFKRVIESIDKDLSSTDMLKAAASIVILSSAFLIIAGAITAMTVLTNGMEFTGFLSWIGVLTIFAVLMITFKTFLDDSKDINTTDMLKTASAIVIMSSVFLVIAGALTAMTVLTEGKEPSAIASFVLIILSFAAVVAAIYILAKKFKDPKQLLAISGSIAIAASSLLIIAAAISMLDGIKVDETFKEKMIALIVPFGLLVALITLAATVSDNIDPLAIASIGGTIVIAAASMLIIAEAIKQIVAAMTGVDENQIKSIQGIMLQMMGLFAVLTLLGGILGGIGGIGTAILIGIAAIMGAFLIFAAGVDLIAIAIEKLVNSVEKLNEMDLDSKKIKKNFESALTGIAEAIKAAIPVIAEAAMLLIAAILVAVTAKSALAGVAAVAYVLAFLAGIAASLPAILDMLSYIMQEVVDWLEQPGQMELIESFFEKVGEALTRIIIGAIKGIFKVFYDEFDELFEKYGLYDRMEEKAQNRRKESHLEEVESAQKQQIENILDYYSKQANFVSSLEFSMGAKASTVEDDVWKGLVDNFNRVADAARQSGDQLTEDTIERARQTLKYAPEEILRELDSVYGVATDTVGDFIETVDVANQELCAAPANASSNIQTLTRDTEESKEAVDGLADSVSKTNEEMSNSSDDLAKKTEEANAKVEKLTNAFSSMGDSTKNIIKSVDVKKLMKDLGVDYETGFALLGKVTGQSFGEEYEKTLDYYMEDAMKMVYGKNGIYQQKWKSFLDDKGQQIYSSAEQYANAMMDKQTENTSYAADKLSELWGINLDLNDVMKDGTDILGDLGSSLSGVGDEAGKTKSKFQEFTDSLKDSIKSSLNIFNEVTEDEMISPEEMLYRMEENTRKVGEWARNITILAARGMSEGLLNQLKDMGPEGAAKVKAFVNMTDEQLQIANRRYATSAALPDYATKEIVQSYKDAGFNASLGFANGIDSSAANDAMTELGTNSLDALKTELDEHSPSRKTEEMGKLAVEGLANGLKDQAAQNMIRSASKTIAGILLKSLKQDLRIDKLLPIGSDILNGIGMGVDKGTPTLLSKINSLASRILGAFAKVLVIHSPSKAMAELGEYAMEGFGEGMEDGSTNVESLSEKTANDILDAMKANIASVTDGWSEDNVYSPVIRPVFDMDAINQGYTDIQTWFANAQGLNLNGNISRLTPTSRDETDTNQQLIDAIKSIDNDRVVDELVALRNDISDLQSAMSNMQVVMNSGALVGQIVDDMDRALGSKAILNSRGRY